MLIPSPARLLPLKIGITLSRSSRAASALGRVLALGFPHEESVGGCVPESILLGSRTNSGRKNLGPGGSLVRGSDDSASSSRTGTPTGLVGVASRTKTAEIITANLARGVIGRRGLVSVSEADPDHCASLFLIPNSRNRLPVLPKQLRLSASANPAPRRLDGPNDMGWLVLRVARRRRRSSLPTLLEA
jgi:hypothetical protein